MNRAFLITWCALFVSAGLARGEGKFINLGPQVTAKSIQGSEFVKDSSGRDLIYTAERGQPGHLLAYDAITGEPVLDASFRNCDGAWEVGVSSDGWLYTTGGNGHLYRHKPGTKAIEDLGDALGEKVIWDVTAGENGEMYAGTYPGCRVMRYKPASGFSDVGHGAMVEGENYVRAVVYDPRTRKIYAGVGSHAHLIELDPETGVKKELLAKETAGQEAVYSLQIVPDEKSGDRLLAWVMNRGKTLVYNLRTKKVERELPTADVKAVKKSPKSEDVYYSNGTNLMSFDLDHPEAAPRKRMHSGIVNAMQWVNDDQVSLLNRSGDLIHYDVHDGKSTEQRLHLPPQPIPIQSIALGPDGKIWIGGFLAGGTTAFDPATGKSVEYRGMSQIERIGVLDGEMYFGVYPHGRFYRFDPSQAWGANNPRKFGQIEGQSRPIAVLGVPELDKVFIGEVPEYGFLGGHLIEYDPTTDKVRDHGEVVARQSVVSLVFAENEIIGGTSIFGGLGIPPSETEGRLFGWDPVSEKKIFEVAPVPGARAITAIIVGPDKNVWGIADGVLFVFDPREQKVVSTQRLVNVHYDFPSVWRDAFMLIHPSGQIYVTVNGRFLRLDPISKGITMLRDKNAVLLAMDGKGRFYFQDGINLWQYVP